MSEATTKAGGHGPVTAGDAAVRDRFLADGSAVHVPWVESPFFASQLATRELSAQEKSWAQQFHDDGFVVLEEFFDGALLEEVIAEYPRIFDHSALFDVPPEVDKLLKQDVNRVQDAWWVSKPVKRLACDARILGLLELLYGRAPVPFQTLNFVTGTEQHTHSDAIHFSSVPARFMCGVWVALEDITEKNGPLSYYPGSHKLPDTRLEELGIWATDHAIGAGPDYPRYEEYLRAVIQALGLQQQRLTCKKGTALIWAANLMHGGTPIEQEGTTRLSQVTHYFFENCLYYTPILSNLMLGEYFLKAVQDIRSGEWLEHTINGERLATHPLPSGRHLVTRRGSKLDTAAPAPAAPSITESDSAADTRQVIQALMEEQARIVQGARFVSPVKRAEVLAKLADVALRAVDGGGKGT